MELTEVLNKMKAVCSSMSLRDVFTHILFLSTYHCSRDDKCWKFYVFKRFNCEGHTVSVVIDDITTFILENWLQWQDWILAKLQQSAGLEAFEPENVELEFDFKSKEMLQNWRLDGREMERNVGFRLFVWFEDTLHTRAGRKVHIPQALSKLQTLPDFLAARATKNEKGRAKKEGGHGKTTANSRISGMSTSGLGTSGMGASA